MKNNRVRLTSYISPDLDDLLNEYMEDNNINSKSQALERLLIEFKYMRTELDFLRTVVSGGGYAGQNNISFSAPRSVNKPVKERDRVKDTIADIFSNMPD